MTSPAPSRRRPTALAITAMAIVVALLVGLGTAVWQLWGTDALARGRADDLVATTRQHWARGGASGNEPGEVVAILSSPRLGITWPVLAGVAPDQLERGLGWYPGTTLPGEPGNMAVAGLRVTHGSPFRRLLDMRPGDEVSVEVPAGRFTYRVRHQAAVVDAGPSGAWVLDAVPGARHAPSTSVLTLTTAADLVATERRAVVFAELVSSPRR